MLKSHQEFRDLLPGYALGALDPGELRLIETHLQSCNACQQELRDFELVEDGLLEATPPAAPPAHLRSRLAKSLTDSRETRPTPIAASAKRNFFSGLSWLPLATGLAAIILLALNLNTYGQLRALQNEQAALHNQLLTSQTALELVSRPDGATMKVKGPGSSGSLITSDNVNTGVLYAQGLAALDPSQTYQVWLIDSTGTPVSVGTFSPEPGQTYITVLIISSEPITHFSAMGVTIEPMGGLPQPTGPMVLSTEY
jgi:anti-sigma-K factor RskA